MRRTAIALLALAWMLPTTGLTAASETVSISVRPVILGPNDRASIVGLVGSGRADQLVTIQFRPCDETSWREIAETRTNDAGGFAVDVSPGIRGALRAASAGALSDPVEVRQRLPVSFVQRPPGTFTVWVNAQRSFWHKRATVERFDPRRRSWVPMRTILLTESGAPPGVPWVFAGSEKFKLAVPKETRLRARMPTSQARPCYLAGTSNVLVR